jgi:hypothetical protein
MFLFHFAFLFRRFSLNSRRNDMARAYLDEFSSSLSKLARFFKRSRDGWKAKHHELKAEAKLLRNQTRAVEKSREQWRERASVAEQRVAELEVQLEQLKFRREYANHE